MGAQEIVGPGEFVGAKVLVGAHDVVGRGVAAVGGAEVVSEASEGVPEGVPEGAKDDVGAFVVSPPDSVGSALSESPVDATLGSSLVALPEDGCVLTVGCEVAPPEEGCELTVGAALPSDTAVG